MGVFGALLNGWLFATFIHSHLLIFKSHILVFNLCAASLGRNLLGFPFSGSSAVAKRWLFGPSCCQLFAFFNQFFGVFQMTSIFVLILERYIQVKFYKREKSVYIRLYWTLIAVSWINSFLFATPPLFGYGLYSCDTTGTSCTFLWPSMSSGAKQLGYAVPYILICGLIPIVAMFYYMGKALRLEKIFYKGEQQREQKCLTQSAHAVCVGTLALWIPAAVLAGWQWVPLLIKGYRPHVPPTLALIASIASEAATTVPVLCYLAVDERLRAALLGRMRKQYALLQPERAKIYKRV
ncbi:visual pigment-like receptor peropsin isoform X2 [Bombyx mandarina]|uniref:G-protein coupled receptors family 1 profile domain-containing protein n=2 Tax=Bombyx TaxID=7090 RepID=A0A8R2M9Z5_BOMMO|nr:visual pigment-like receptor peropsin isoform X2 [Bombyx mandarina]XP_037877699.1 visual pigment-like receptor peropsin isoform X2 [Bombyx mori]XP_037877700.1 visual pigment-like receptor peropsin isoform X2 [Bombyx mori]